MLSERSDDVYIVGEAVLPISRTLMGVSGATVADIKTVCKTTDIRSCGSFSAVSE